jgi:hypothetical protein
MKYRVYGQFTVSGSIEVAVPDGTEDPEQVASEMAEQQFGKPKTYAGNGSISGLAGFAGQGIGLEVTALEIDDIEEVHG